jgi:hypothetical protein
LIFSDVPDIELKHAYMAEDAKAMAKTLIKSLFTRQEIATHCCTLSKKSKKPVCNQSIMKRIRGKSFILIILFIVAAVETCPAWREDKTKLSAVSKAWSEISNNYARDNNARD